MGFKAPKQILGWREWLGLPELGVAAIKAKIDTGARTSALHADDIRIIRRGDRRMVKFFLAPRQRSHQGAREVEAPFVGYRQVRSSNGRVEKRPVIETAVAVGAERWRIEITLTGRDTMGFRMLLGRQALRRRARVDPERSFVAGPRQPAEPEPDGAGRPPRPPAPPRRGAPALREVRPQERSNARSPGDETPA